MLMGNAASPGTVLADHVFRDIQNCVLRATTELAAIKSPQTEYEQDVAKVQAFLNDNWKRLYAAADPNERAAIQNEIVQYGRDLQLLESKFKSGLELATSKYEQRTDAVVQRLSDNLVATLGPTRIRRTLRGLEPQYLVDYLPEGRATTQLNDVYSPSAVRKLEASPISSSILGDHDKDTTTVAEPRTRHGVKRRRTVDDTSSDRAAKRRATAENRKLLSRRRRRSKRKNGVDDKGHDQQIAAEDLTPGDVYLVREQLGGWSAVLLLPINAPDNDVVSATFENIGLPANPPKCYVFDGRSKTYKWRRGYEDGGSLVSERSYPVMYFDGHNLPTKTMSWLAAAHFRAYDEETARSLKGYFQVQDYLQRGAILEDQVDKSDKTIYVNGDASRSTTPNNAAHAVNSSDSEASALTSTCSLSASEPLPATRDTTVLEEPETASSRPSHANTQMPLESPSLPELEGCSKSLEGPANDQSLPEDRCSGRSPSLDMGTEEPHVSSSTQKQEQHAAAQEQAGCSPPTATKTEPAVAAQPAGGDSLEKVLGDSDRTPRLDYSQPDDCPSVGGLVLPAQTRNGGPHGCVRSSLFRSSLQARSPALVATRPGPSEPNVAGRTSTVAPSKGPQGPFATFLDTQAQHKATLPTPKMQPCMPARTWPEISPPEVIRSPSQPGLTIPQPISSHFPPPFAGARGRQGTAMPQLLPPIRTAEEMWPTRPSVTDFYVGAGSSRAGPNTLSAEADPSASFQRRYPTQQTSARDPSLDTQITTPRTLQNPKSKRPGEWPTDVSQALLRDIEGTFRRRNGLRDDFNVFPDNFKRPDNNYHCPLCSESERKWKLAVNFFKHLRECHGGSV